MKKREFKHRDADTTRAKILDVARLLFSRAGFEGARTDLLASKAGVTKAMINYYFGGKLGLYRELIVHDMQRLHQTIAQQGLRELPPGEKLAKLITVLSHGYRENPYLVRILVREQMSGSKNLEPRVWKTLMKFYETVQAVVQEGQQAGIFRTVDAHATHLSMVGALIFYLITEPARKTYARSGDLPPTPDWNQYVTHVTQLFLQGIANQTKQKRS